MERKQVKTFTAEEARELTGKVKDLLIEKVGSDPTVLGINLQALAGILMGYSTNIFNIEEVGVIQLLGMQQHAFQAGNEVYGVEQADALLSKALAS